MQVDLVYDPACPNKDGARVQLLRAFAQLGLVPRWREWDASQVDAPSHVRGVGSPTILVNSQAAGGETVRGDAACCRLYTHRDGAVRGVPNLPEIVSALAAAHRDPSSNRPRAAWKMNGAWLPAVGVAFLPKLVCPACWPAYAGLLGALGFGFFDYTPYLLPLTAIFLVLALAGLAWRAGARRGYGPLLLGTLAATLILAGKFLYDNDVAMYLAVVLLIGASVWNTWPIRADQRNCGDCAGRDNDSPKLIRRTKS